MTAAARVKDSNDPMEIATAPADEPGDALSRGAPRTAPPAAHVLSAARAAYKAGLCVLPVKGDGSKAPDAGSWSTYQQTRPTEQQMTAWRFAQRSGLGMIAGAVSGSRECWDFDSAPAFDAFLEIALATGLGELVARIRAGYEDRTPAGGRRWIVKYPEGMDWEDCTLARRPGLADEPKVKTLIELPTFAILAPSGGSTHPSGKAYERLSGAFESIASYTADERNALIALARSFDQMPRPEASAPREAAISAAGARPGDDYAARVTWPEILEPQGWSRAYARGEVTYWLRPGKTTGVSATTNHAGLDRFYPFTSSSEFTAEQCYSKFAVYATLQHGGDFSAAARALAADGFGERTARAMPAIRGANAGVIDWRSWRCDDAVDVAREGRELAAAGIRYAWDGVIPAYGMLGFLVAFAKVGKTTFGQALAAHVAKGLPFLDRETQATRVLIIAAEDPPEYTAWLARHMETAPGQMTIVRQSIVLSDDALGALCDMVAEGGYGLVLIASWQAVVRGLVRDENDNAGAALVVENVKAAARKTRIPWLIDAHSGKGEDQQDDADPSKAMRGASAAAGAADYTLSLRYANGAFGTQRRLSGKGRFVSIEPILMEFDPASSAYTAYGAVKGVQAATDWRMICETGALSGNAHEKRSIREIAVLAGLIPEGTRALGRIHTRVSAALNRPDVGRADETRSGKKTATYWRFSGDSAPMRESPGISENSEPPHSHVPLSSGVGFRHPVRGTVELPESTRIQTDETSPLTDSGAMPELVAGVGDAADLF